MTGRAIPDDEVDTALIKSAEEASALILRQYFAIVRVRPDDSGDAWVLAVAPLRGTLARAEADGASAPDGLRPEVASIVLTFDSGNPVEAADWLRRKQQAEQEAREWQQ